MIRANDRMLNLDANIVVTSRGRPLYEGPMRRSIRLLANTLRERGDPASIFSSEIVVRVPESGQ